jgi:integrase/recombinase XerD
MARRPRTPRRSFRSLFKGSDQRSMRGNVAAYLEWMEVHSYSEDSVETRAQVLHYFALWCEERGIVRSTEVTRPILQRYQRWMFYYRKKNGQPLGVTTQYTRLMVVTVFFRWLTRNNFLLYNPASELELPRTERRLPKAILTVEEVEKVLAEPDLADPLGLRDRAILETLYSTGIRRKELAALTLFALDQDRGTLMVRLGKGKKDRVVPIGERALLWVEKYLREVRPRFAVEPDEGFLFLGGEGTALTPGHLSDLVRSYVDAAGIGKKGSCHLLRHTMATLMLEGGADVRFIQAMLGHEALSSTQLYTQVAIRKLKEIHTATHPAAKLERRERPADGAAVDASDEREELLASLAVEAAEEEDDAPATS